MEQAIPQFVDRRVLADRRRSATPLFRSPFSPRRRRGFRRKHEARGAYLDHLCPSVILWTACLLSLSAIDAALTLVHIQLGGQELVPTMKWALDSSNQTFVFLKMCLTGCGAAFLAAHYNFGLSRFFSRAVLWGYIVLMLYHLTLVSTHWPL